jgi:hypothetical protein
MLRKVSARWIAGAAPPPGSMAAAPTALREQTKAFQLMCRTFVDWRCEIVLVARVSGDGFMFTNPSPRAHLTPSSF